MNNENELNSDVLVASNTLNDENYRNVLEQKVPALLVEVPLLLRRKMFFLHDEASAHFSRISSEYRNPIYPDRWIGWSEPVQWPPRFPDCNSLDFFLFGSNEIIKNIQQNYERNIVLEYDEENVDEGCELIFQGKKEKSLVVNNHWPWSQD